MPPITERPRAPSGVAVFMSTHSKTPYITPSMDFYSRKGVVRGRRVQQLGFALRIAALFGAPETVQNHPVRVGILSGGEGVYRF